MRKVIGISLAALLFLAALSFVGETSALELNPYIPGISIPDLPIFTLSPPNTPTPAPTLKIPTTLIPIPIPTFAFPIPTFHIPATATLIPVPIPTLAPLTPAPDPVTPAPAPTAKPTAKPQAPQTQALKGAAVTSFGLYFEELRPKLTDTWHMFTPLDLSVQGMLTYPLVGNNTTIVGNVIITVAGGQLTVTYQAAPGVTTTREFFTLFPNLDAIQTLNVDLLGGQARPFGQPIDIQQVFGEDRKVILYLNNLADYDAAKSGLAPFVPEQHRAFMQNLMPLLD